MKDRYYVELVKRAVLDNDTDMLAAIGTHLCDCEDAKRILRLKGWGVHGMSNAATAHLVPCASPADQLRDES